ncbi:MAG: HPr(Ser) kinase/phosphatase [Gammaproteobacteria bacterium]|nr:HPr(Ser) kinase/phosphatase [Gammaproteobacteria bacterium]
MTEFTNKLTVQDLFTNHGEKLGLEWIAGQQGGRRMIVPERSKDSLSTVVDDDLDKFPKPGSRKTNIPSRYSLVGYLNLIHANQIQVLGDMELNYIESLRDISRQDAIRQIFKHQPACVIVSEGRNAPVILKRKCNENNIPLFCSSLPSNKLIDSLHYYLSNLFADVTTLHGVFMEVNAIGVLITGPSGIGKSELALELITRGHRLVADDAPQFSRIAPDIINGTCPKALQDFLEVRGLGIINVRELFGDSAIKINKYLRLIVRLAPMKKAGLLQIDRFEGSYKTRRVLDLEIPEITVPVAPGRNLAVLLECAARNHMLRMGGYNASEKFSERQRLILEQGNK